MLKNKSVLSIFETCVYVRAFLRRAALWRGCRAKNSKAGARWALRIRSGRIVPPNGRRGFLWQFW